MDAKPKFGTWYPASQDPPMREIYNGSPLTSGQLIVFNGHYVWAGSLEESYMRRKRGWKSATGHSMHVTHWMPMPPKPECGDESE